MTERQHRARGQARRDALLRAAVEVAAERGAAGITHRAVTQKAGVPLATASYFFTSIDELADEALRTFAAESIAALNGLTTLLAEVNETPNGIAKLVSQAVAPDLRVTLAQMEAYLHSARTPGALREAVADTIDAFYGVAVAAARAAGSPQPERIARTLVAVIDGLTLHHLAAPRDDWRLEVESAIRTLFLGHLVELGRADEAERISAESDSAAAPAARSAATE